MTEEIENNGNNNKGYSPDNNHPHKHFAARRPAGSRHPILISKKGIIHTQLLPNGDNTNNASANGIATVSSDSSDDDKNENVTDNNINNTREIISVGLASSELFSGSRLAHILQTGFDYERNVMEALRRDATAAPLSIHTSGGVPAALGDFIKALEPHLPWKRSETKDWFVSLQVEGASAVFAAVDILIQRQIAGGGWCKGANAATTKATMTTVRDRKLVAVAERSYHGPPSTSFGSGCPLWNEKYQQVTYPCPVPGNDDEEEVMKRFESFLKENGDDIGVLLVEPQSGSSLAGYPWPPALLKKYIELAHENSIYVVADEIMCGLGRHGQGDLFLSKSWRLDVDAVTFGKSIAGGVYPLSGVIVKNGASLFGSRGGTTLQSHTYAGSSVRALMAATETLKFMGMSDGGYLGRIAKLGEEMERVFRRLEMLSGGMVLCHGQGLLWGGIFQDGNDGSCRSGGRRRRGKMRVLFERYCEEAAILPYFVPVGGFTVTPIVDIDECTIREIGRRLEQVIIKVVSDIRMKT